MRPLLLSLPLLACAAGLARADDFGNRSKTVTVALTATSSAYSPTTCSPA